MTQEENTHMTDALKYSLYKKMIMKKKEILNKIGQLQFEISLLELDKDKLTGVTIRTDELKELVKKSYTIEPQLKDMVKHDVAEQYAKFCVICDRKKLPLINLKDYLSQL